MAKYKVSVIVPTYNSGLFLNAFFDSIMYQSIGFENIEVIFVDDCSNDEYTLYLLKLFDENFSNVKSVFLEENDGFPGKGRNIGLNFADSEFVIFSDHDDTYVPQAFEVLYNTAIENDADMVITNYYRVFPDEKFKVETVFAGENIVILGNLRGLAHAGAKGNKNAIIAAGSIEAPQIRIANKILERERDALHGSNLKTFAFLNENEEIVVE